MGIISKLMVLVMFLLFSGCAAMTPDQTRLHLEAEIGRSGDATEHQLSQLCEAYLHLRRYDRLFECCERLENNLRKEYRGIGYSASVPYVLRAQAYIDLGQFEKAIGEAKKGFDIASGEKNQIHIKIAALGLLGSAYALHEDRENAIKVINQLKSPQASTGFIVQKVINIHLTNIYVALKEYQKAIDVIQQDSGIIIPEIDKIYRSFQLNKCFLETGQTNKAKSGYDELLKIPQISDIGGIYWLILFDRGRIAEQEGNLREAVGFYRQAVDVIEQQRSTINTEADKIGFVGDKQSAYHRLISVLYRDGQYATAFEYVERSKSRALVDMLAAKKDFAVRSSDELAIRDLLAENTANEAELSVQDLSLNKSELRSIVIKNRGKLREQSPELASLVCVTSLATAEIQSNIPGDEVLVEYYYAEKDMIAFILSAQGLKAIKLNSDNLADDIQQFRKLLDNPASSGYMESSHRLYARLIQPIESSLGHRNLIIVPHGSLHYLPFNVLHNGKGYLIDHYSIRVLPSASVIKYLTAKKSSQPANILVFGNPDLGDPRYDLVYAQNEAIAVAKTQPLSKVLLRKKATETAFKKYGGGFNYIHFATHGQFNADAPLSSALWLARDTESDGMLTVDKLYSTKLDADLVTLSACETGLGKIANGDDIVGLSRGFLYAGSSSIVASLWKVDDLATSDLMTRFYSTMKTKDKREALRSAQLDTMSKYPHPFYWASFQLTGNAK